MTEATTTRPTKAPSIAPSIHYQVGMSHPESHLFEVMLRVQGWQMPVLDLKMPVWTPGSYLVREYAKHLQDFSAANDKQSLPWRKLSKNHWQIETAGVSQVSVHYRIFAAELSVRTNHLDATHGYFNPAALFFYLPGFEHTPIQVTIVPPQQSWRVTTPLPPVPGGELTFLAPDFDTLVDSPFEIGCHQSYEFEVLGIPHELAIWGQHGNAEPQRMIPDITKIIQVEAQLFGGLPYNRYVFLLHLSSLGYGGLEHKDCCSLNYPRLGFRAPDKYHRFLQLVAHEFFHLWNVKRIRPALGTTRVPPTIFDYEAENYTPSLWFSEGTTSYYDLLIPFRAGLYDAKSFLRELSKEISRLQTTPGRSVQPLSESSWDTWIKLYRPDANSANSQVSYYLKGAVVSLLLDLLIRSRHGNGRSLDNVMRQMWQQFGIPEIGFTPAMLQEVIESVAGIELGDFFEHYIEGTDELPFDEYLAPFGLRLAADEPREPVPYLGLTAKAENGKELIKFVEFNSPAQQAGIDAGDELLAIDGLRVSAEQLGDRLKDYNPGDTIALTVFHQDELLTRMLTLANPRPTSYQIIPVKHPTSVQEKNFQGWLGAPLSSAS